MGASLAAEWAILYGVVPAQESPSSRARTALPEWRRHGRHVVGHRDRVQRRVAELSVTLRSPAHSKLCDVHHGTEPRGCSEIETCSADSLAPVRARLHADLPRARG